MRILYFDCPMGAAGDMLCASMLGLAEDKESFIQMINHCGIPHIKASLAIREKCGISGLGFEVAVHGEHEDEHMHEHHHHHASLGDIKELIQSLELPEKVKSDACAVYDILAKAESKVHGCEIENIHFHEVGTLDAVCDIVTACALIDMISPDRIIASPINVGSGMVKCAHGILPVPAPATAEILKGIPFYKAGNTGELCTPTGAAILKYFVNEFAVMPAACVEKIGYGMGKKDFETANCVAAYLGNTDDSSDSVYELICNLDDMTGEQMSFASEILMENGALDVYTEPIYMKKARPAHKLCCICKIADKDKMADLIFKHTTTIGIRYAKYDRITLSRKIVTEETKYGKISVKVSSGHGVLKKKREFDELAKIAKENNISVLDIK